MLDPRIPDVRVNDPDDNGRVQTFFCFAGKRFNSIEALTEYSNSYITRAETLAGRPLTSKELLHGLRKHDSRPVAEKMAAEAFKPTPKQATKPDADTEVNPFRNQVPETDGNGHLTQAGNFKLMADKWDAKRNQAPPDAPSPAQVRAKMLSEQLLFFHRFSPDSSVSDIALAEQLIAQADHDLTTFETMYKAAKGAVDDRHAAAAKLIEFEAKRIAETKADIPEFDPTPIQQPRAWGYREGVFQQISGPVDE